MSAVGSGSPRVYLAGPEVFLPREVVSGVRQAKLRACEALGLEGVFPGEPSGDASAGSGPERAAAFFDILRAELDSCAAAIANLTPFRGPSADSGTVWEVGYLIGQGKPVVGYTNVVAHYEVRAAALDDHGVEAFTLADNLMVDRGIVRSNGGIEVVRCPVDAGSELTDLTAFERCVALVAGLLA